MDLLTKFNYVVEIDGIPIMGFSEASGLDVEIDEFLYREGDSDGFVSKFPGLPKVSDVTLKKGLALGPELNAILGWFEECIGYPDQPPEDIRKNVVIRFQNKAKTKSLGQVLEGAWVKRFDIGGAEGTSSDRAVAEFVFTYERPRFLR